MPSGIYKHKTSGMLGKHHSEKTKKVMSEKRKGNTNGFKKGQHSSFETEFKKGNKINLGIKRTKEVLKKMSEEKSHFWKGDNAGNQAMHNWIEKWKGQPLVCEQCGIKVKNTRQIHWANKNHTYKRILKDYIRLCINCHKKFDKKNNQYGE